MPLVWAARILRIPVLIHQQDLRPGLANRLMAWAASVITVTFENSLKVYGAKAVLTGNPYFLPALPNREALFKKYNFDLARPLILVFGGGTGSVSINEAVELTKKYSTKDEAAFVNGILGSAAKKMENSNA